MKELLLPKRMGARVAGAAGQRFSPGLPPKATSAAIKML